MLQTSIERYETIDYFEAFIHKICTGLLVSNYDA